MNKGGVKAKLKLLSSCPCGFGVLHDDILLGTEYTIYPDTIEDGATYICGKCKAKQTNVKIVMADSRFDSSITPMPLPFDMFEIEVQG